MKKIIVLVLILLCLCSCSGKEKTEEGETASFGKIIGTVGWVVPPSINATGVGILETEHAAGFPYHLERVGHPQEWDYTAGIGPYYVSENEYVGAPKYTPDSAVVYTEGDNMIFDYDGNLLNPSYNGYWFVQNGGFCSGDYAAEMYYSVYTGDFMGTVYRPVIDGLCGGALSIIEYKDALYTDIADPFHFGIDALGTWCLLWDPDDKIDLEKDVTLKKVTPEDLFGFRVFAFGYDRYIRMSDKDRFSIYDENAVKLFDIPYIDAWYEDFTNGFVTFSKDGKYAFYSVDKQGFISDYEYDDIYPFVEGFAAVRKDDKWAYINEEGEAVTDYIWDSVSTMYEGRVFVTLKDRTGILDLKETLNRGIEVTMESCYGSADENEAYEKAAALQEHQPRQLERDPETVAQEEEFEAKHKVIGIITPVTNSIRIRSKPSTSGEKLGVLRPVDGYNYYRSLFVYEKTENEGYTWYRIGEDRWVADDGSWYKKQMFSE